MMEAAEFRPWSDLPPELLGLVLKRLPSLADRVRLRAVCHPWRSNSMLQPLPLPFPWLTLPDGTFLSIPNGEIHRISLPEGACCQGSIGNWLFLTHNDDVCYLMNPFSKTRLELPKLAKIWKRGILDLDSRFSPIFYKLVVPFPLDSSPCSLVAALIMDDSNCGTLCISEPPFETDSFRDDEHPVLHLGDVAFFDGKLYGLCGSGHLFIFELDKDLFIASMECVIHSLGDLGGTPQSLPREGACMVRDYLVECGGRLLMVIRWFRSTARPTSDDCLEHDRTVALGVFEADLHAEPVGWRTVSDLDGHALFLGQHSSKSLRAGECTGYQEDCIYFMCDYPWPKYSANPLRDAGVYNVRNETFLPLMSGTTAVPPRHAGQWRPTWYFPPEAV
ncbi:uncharacterized protein LOC119287758 [Triticum dicoccoides]|uniref:DUF295 domain-containing protein n=1 Tax=Triticum turgidum subsp. durum TaxID=4567 RepID=A0A9R0W473_TRITD|nr:uncharacterized protein LOC119287758 [Triticum dicoccoides]VAH98131.1 unnamed protein product [Triticum turgidum subsp. durum]